jgi:hypothetical protein
LEIIKSRIDFLRAPIKNWVYVLRKNLDWMMDRICYNHYFGDNQIKHWFLGTPIENWVYILRKKLDWMMDCISYNHYFGDDEIKDWFGCIEEKFRLNDGILGFKILGSEFESVWAQFCWFSSHGNVRLLLMRRWSRRLWRTSEWSVRSFLHFNYAADRRISPPVFRLQLRALLLLLICLLCVWIFCIFIAQQ